MIVVRIDPSEFGGAPVAYFGWVVDRLKAQGIRFRQKPIIYRFEEDVLSGLLPPCLVKKDCMTGIVTVEQEEE